MLNKKVEDGKHLWTFDKITGHHKNKVDGKQIMEVEVFWDTGEKSWEPLNVMKADDSVTVSQYVKGKNLINQAFWRWANRYIKTCKKFLRYCRQVFLAEKKTGPMYKFGI
jgi:hypothetical protein